MGYALASKKYLSARLSLLDTLLKRYLYIFRLKYKYKNEYAGLVISDQEIDNLFDEKFNEDCIDSKDKDLLDVIDCEINYKRKIIAEIELNQKSNENIPAFSNLGKKFNLSLLHQEIILVALAVEINSKYEKIFSYIQNDITRKLPTIELIGSFINKDSELFQERNWFSDKSPLIEFDLIEFISEPSRSYTPFPSQYIKISTRVMQYLLGIDSIDEKISTFTKKSTYNNFNIHLTDVCISGIIESITGNKEVPRIIYLQNVNGIDNKDVADSICTAIKCSNLILFSDPFLDECNIVPVIKRIFREALLSESAVYFDIWINKYLEPSSFIIQKIIEYTERTKILVFFSGEQIWEPGRIIGKVKFTRVQIDFPSYEEQKKHWKKAFNGYLPINSDKVFAKIQSVFKLSRSQIYDVASTAIRLSQNTSKKILEFEDIYSACRIHSCTRMGNLARKINLKHEWNDIVLPAEKIMQLKELCSSIQNRSKVYGEWEFDKKLTLGKGISALFAGASGTGKTMAAEIIANTLHVELFKIDLSSVVSKYIGETEKNLAKIFQEAENNNAILFFDEADAIMGKRSEVKDAHDRYSNIETAYLLQRMEEYSGISLLATNFRQNIDSAFVRRIRFIIEFPVPDNSLRKDIWKKIWASGVPLSEDIDFDFIAQKFELSGGNIRNIALHAAFLAAEQNSEVKMVHILSGIKRELQKMGKVCIDQDFGKYQGLTTGIKKSGARV